MAGLPPHAGLWPLPVSVGCPARTTARAMTRGDAPEMRVFAAISATCETLVRVATGQPFCLKGDVLQSQVLPEVFTPAEIARASGVTEAEVLALVEAGAIVP